MRCKDREDGLLALIEMDGKAYMIVYMIIWAESLPYWSRKFALMEYKNNVCIHSYSLVKKSSVHQSSTESCLDNMLCATSNTWHKIIFYRGIGHIRSPSKYSNPDLFYQMSWYMYVVFVSWYIEM